MEKNHSQKLPQTASSAEHGSLVSHRLLAGIVVASLVAHAGFVILGRSVLESWRWQQVPIHSVVEATGAFFALCIAALLLRLQAQHQGTSFNLCIASALASMGILDGLHACASPGDVFVWLHTLATLSGSLLFAMIWLPPAWRERCPGPAAIAATTSGAGLTILLFSLSPQMTVGEGFAPAARVSNTLAGVLLVFAALRLISSFWRTGNENDLLFVVHCLLFGSAALMFGASRPWDFAWWGWHFLRLAAYGVAFGFVLHTLGYEARLARIADDLRGEVGRRRHAELELQRSNEALEQFAVVAAHDLSSPLRSIGGLLRLLQDGLGGRAQTDDFELLARAQAVAARALLLVDALLQYSRAGRTLQLQPVDTGTVLGDVLNSIQGDMASSGAAIQTAPLPTVRADPLQLSRVFQNLLDNAIKFRGERPLQIRVSASPHADGWKFEIADNGLGFDTARQSELFRLFGRGSEATRPGAGVGLAICKRIVEAHGGHIWADSSRGEGSRFQFVLPAAQSPAPGRA